MQKYNNTLENIMMQKNKIISFFIIVVVAIIDQISKNYILETIKDINSIQTITSFMNFTLVKNEGITFGLFNNLINGTIIFSVLAIIITIMLVIWLLRTQELLISAALGLIIGGAIGNIIDRLRYGAVIDFIDFHINHYHWYSFNIADAAICIGVILLILDNLYGTNDEKN